MKGAARSPAPGPGGRAPVKGLPGAVRARRRVSKSWSVGHACRRVLVIEDDADLREAIAEFLASEGIDPILAAGGHEALEALGRGPSPDVILLDLGMPGIPGTELLERLRRDARWRDIPVAVMTGFSRNHFRYAPPADEFIQKPFELDRLNEALAALCRKAKTGRTA